jgi:hypothetical protein
LDRELAVGTPSDAATAPAGSREEVLDLEGERIEVLEGESGAAGLGEHVAVEVAAAVDVAVPCGSVHWRGMGVGGGGRPPPRAGRKG